MLALVAAFKSLGAWLLANALDPRFWAMAAIIAAAGFVKGCEFDATRFKEWRDTAEQVGQKQQAWSRARDAAAEKANKEVVDVLVKGQVVLARDNDALRKRLRTAADRSILPDASAPSACSAGGSAILIARDRFDAESRSYFAARAEQLARDHATIARARLALAACLGWDDAQRAVEAALPSPVTGSPGEPAEPVPAASGDGAVASPADRP